MILCNSLSHARKKKVAAKQKWSQRETQGGHRERKNYRPVEAEEREEVTDTFGRNCGIYGNDEI